MSCNRALMIQALALVGLLYISAETTLYSQPEPRKPNHLIDEKSPYLLEHAYNPVDWYPWGEAAFERAVREQKPIFLSVGFATCYWCHLMAVETFSDVEIARFLNDRFVSIKVDREERPDVDQVYMSFIQASTGGFGWPLSVFLTPDRRPFYGAGYYRKDAFERQIRKISHEWESNRRGVLESAGGVTELLSKLHEQPDQSDLAAYQDVLDESYQFYLRTYDSKGGGFGKAPKFPLPDVYSFLFRYHRRTGKRGPLQMATQSLIKMAQGGIRDHLAGGFHRYSTDDRWIVPRFEKILFIQAQLAVSYLEAFQLTGESELETTAREILDFSLVNLRGETGGFFSAIDGADFCPDEPAKVCQGLYYTWSDDELKDALGDEYPLFSFAFGVRKGGNIHLDDAGELKGRNVLYRPVSIDLISERFGLETVSVPGVLERLRSKLSAVRSHRKRPPVDDKQLTSWNGLMISALAKAYQVLGDARYLDAAEQTAEFIALNLYDAEAHRLKRRFRDGVVSGQGFVDDYALFVQGLIDLYESGFNDRWLLLAVELTQRQLSLFWDRDRGGFFNTPGSEEQLLVRVKELYDGVEPSPNGVSTLNLARLAVLMKDEVLVQRARETVEAFSDRFARSPKAMPQLKAAMEFLTAKKKQIIIAGPKNDPLTAKLAAEVHRRFLPNRVLFLADGGEAHHTLGEKLEFLKSVRPIGGKSTVYICEDYICQFPTSDPLRVAELLTTN